MDIYWIQNGQRKGPLPEVEIQSKLESGELTEDMLGWHVNVNGWIPLRDLPALAPFFDVKEEKKKKIQNQTNERSKFGPPIKGDLIVLDESFHSESEISAMNSQSELRTKSPNVILRFGARIFDFFLFQMIFFISFSYIYGNVSWIVESSVIKNLWFVAIIIEETIFLGLLGTTPGKFICGLKVCAQNGEKLSWGASIMRSLNAMLLGMGMGIFFIIPITIFLGYWMVKQNKLTLWDKIAQTYVLDGDKENTSSPTIKLIFLVLSFIVVVFVCSILLAPWMEEIQELNQQIFSNGTGK